MSFSIPDEAKPENTAHEKTSQPHSRRKSYRIGNVALVLIVIVVLGAVIGLISLLSQPSLADKQCVDQLGAGGVWVAAMNQCGCSQGYQMFDGDQCEPD